LARANYSEVLYLFHSNSMKKEYEFRLKHIQETILCTALYLLRFGGVNDLAAGNKFMACVVYERLKVPPLLLDYSIVLVSS
jgi:hypothetical protein